MKSGFAGTRLMTMAWPYVYRIAGSSLYRYKFAYTNGQPAISAPVKLSGSGWDAYASPAAIASTVLKASGWSPFTSLSRGWCDSRPNGRVLLGITAGGRASVHFDANETDGAGTDIKGGSLGLLGWTEKAY